MQKIVINVCHGGFGLSEEATERYKQLEGITKPDWWVGDINRDDPVLIQVVEEFGPLANDRCSELKIVEIPDGTNWEIDEYDGIETVHEVHQYWS